MRDRKTPGISARTLQRRHFFGLAGLPLAAGLMTAGLGFPSTARAWVDDGLSDADTALLAKPRLIVGGGPDSLPGETAPILAQALAHGLATPGPIATRYDYGRDGVTAANLFDTVAPEADGSTAILAPGAALIASLSGDNRVHFDFSRWASLMVAQRPVVTLARAELRRTLRTRIAGMFHDRPVRIALSHPTGVELASLLGLSILGFHPVPVTGFATKGDALLALRDGLVDAVQLTPGPNDDLAADIASAPGGAAPVFYCGLHVNAIPTFEDAFRTMHGRSPAGSLYNAWIAVANAAATALVVALPMLTQPLAVARWRHAASAALDDQTLIAWNTQQHLSVTAGDASAPLLANLTPDLSALLALRRWINNNAPRWRLGQETRPT